MFQVSPSPNLQIQFETNSSSTHVSKVCFGRKEASQSQKNKRLAQRHWNQISTGWSSTPCRHLHTHTHTEFTFHFQVSSVFDRSTRLLHYCLSWHLHPIIILWHIYPNTGWDTHADKHIISTDTHTCTMCTLNVCFLQNLHGKEGVSFVGPKCLNKQSIRLLLACVNETQRLIKKSIRHENPKSAINQINVSVPQDQMHLGFVPTV